MTWLKEKIPVLIGILIFLVLCGGALYYFDNNYDYYYTQIDNDKVEKKNSHDDMNYVYTLDCYNDKGKRKSISFKTSRELRSEAFLKLKVIPVTGVNKWEEVTYDDLPEKVQEKYPVN